MKIKTYIAVVLTFVFLAKLVALDANGLNLIFSASDIRFVNPHCEKNVSNTKSNNVPSFSQHENVKTQMITLDGHCNAPFQFELFSWKAHYSNPIAVFEDHFTSNLNFRYLDSVSPPPQEA